MKPGEFVTADTHFGHRRICDFANRPFTSVDEMDDELIKRWNAKVPLGSIVYHLGDFALCHRDRAQEIAWQLNGLIRLVRGNHDKVVKGMVVNAFDWVKDYYEARNHLGTKVVMSHYAMLTWNKAHHGAWMLHGHSHGSLHADQRARRLDVGVDTHPNYEPWSYDEIAERMQGRGHVAVDHHGDAALDDREAGE